MIHFIVGMYIFKIQQEYGINPQEYGINPHSPAKAMRLT